MKSYKFQALVTMYADGDPCAVLGPAPRRMVLRGRNDESGHSQVFNALVSCDDEKPFRPGSPRVVATVRLAGDDVADYVAIGGHFDLLLGGKVGDGVITRRLFVLPDPASPRDYRVACAAVCAVQAGTRTAHVLKLPP